MKRLTLEDTDILYKIIDTEKFPYAISELILKLKNPTFFIFTDGKSIISYEPVFGDILWFNTHSWSLKEGRGKKLKKLYLDSGNWIFCNTVATSIVAIVPDKMKRQGVFLSHMGAKRIGENDGNILYAFNKEDWIK